MNRIKIVEYSDLLINQIDLKVEQFIADCHRSPNGQEYIDDINTVREKWIAEIRECQEFNLAECGDKKEQIEDCELFKRFCFLFEWPRGILTTSQFTWRLISTDKWLSETQIYIFQTLINHLDKNLVGTIHHIPRSYTDLAKVINNIKIIHSHVDSFPPIFPYTYNLN